MYIYVDESGDLGFNEKSSKNFIITFLVAKNGNQIQKLYSKIRKFKKNKKFDARPYLHAHKEKKETIEFALKEISKADIEIFFIILTKNSNNKKSSENLYSQTLTTLLDNFLQYKEKQVLYNIVLSQLYKNSAMNNKLSNILGRLTVRIEIKKVFEDIGLQLFDFTAWAIFQKQERKNNLFYDIISNKIIKGWEVKI
jgi:hypothetical protein